MKFYRFGIVMASATTIFALAGCNMIPNLSDNAGNATTDGSNNTTQQQNTQQQKDANTATKPSKTQDASSESEETYNKLADKYDSETLSKMQAYIDDVKKTSDKSEVLIDTDKITVTVTGIGTDYENSNGYMLEVTNKTDKTVYLQSNDTSIGSDKMSLFVAAAPNTTTKGFAFFDPGVKFDASSSLRGSIVALYGDYSVESFDVLF